MGRSLAFRTNHDRTLVFLLGLAAVLLVSGQDDGPECHCGMFITNSTDEYKVHRLPPFNLDNCGMIAECKTMCADAYDEFTGGGDLNYELASGYNVGQEICILLANQGINHLWHETVYGYARQCNGPWDYDGRSSINRLCCRHGHYTECT